MSQRTPKSSAAELREKLGISLGERSQYTDKAWELVKWADDADMLSAHIRNWETLTKKGGYKIGDIIMLPWGWCDELIKPLEPWWSQVKIISVGCRVNLPKFVKIAAWESEKYAFTDSSMLDNQEYYEVEYPDGERKWWGRDWISDLMVEPHEYLWGEPNPICQAMSIPRSDWYEIPEPFVKDYGKAYALCRFSTITKATVWDDDE